MTDPRSIEQSIEAVVQALAAALNSDGEAGSEAQADLKNRFRAALELVARPAAESTSHGANDIIDRETIRRVIAPELERYWARQRKDRLS